MKHYSFSVAGYTMSVTIGFSLYKENSETRWEDSVDEDAADEWASAYGSGLE